MTTAKKIGTAVDARRLIETYVKTGRATCGEKVSREVCVQWFPPGVFGYGDGGLVTPEEQTALRTKGFSDEFIGEVARDNGKYALRRRVRRLAKDVFGFSFTDSDEERFARVRGMVGLAKIGEEAKEYIFEGLYHDEAPIRRAATQGLGNLTSEPDKAIGLLRKMLEDTSESVRIEAVVTLRKFGRRAGPAFFDLVKLLKDEEETCDVKLAVVMTLMEIESDKAMVAQVIVPYLGKLGDDRSVDDVVPSLTVDCGVSALPPLLKILEDPTINDWQKGVAALASGKIAEKWSVGEKKGTLWEKVFQALAKMAESEEEYSYIRAQAIGALGFFPKSIDLLWSALKDPDLTIRAASATAISHFKMDEVKAELAKRLNSRSMEERHGALMAVKAFDPVEASVLLPDVIPLTADQESAVASLANTVVAGLDRPNQENFPRLKKLLSHPDSKVRLIAAKKIGDIFGEQVGLAAVPVPASAMNPAQVIAQSIRVLNGQ